MKRQIRRGVFETNSSSVHSITMCSDSDFDRWENGEVLFWEEQNKFATRDEIIDELKTMKNYDFSPCYPDTDWDNENDIKDVFFEEGIKKYEDFFDNYDFETYDETYTTKSGEIIHAFGYYGHD